MMRFFFLFLAMCLPTQADIMAAPMEGKVPANQLRVFDNSCGPTTLYNSFLYGSEPWREITESLEADTAQERIRKMVRTFGGRRSTMQASVPRWNGRKGINAEDLAAIASEMRGDRRLKTLNLSTYFQKKKERNDKLLKRLYKDMRGSLRSGFPPIATLQRYRTRTTAGGRIVWVLFQSHFVSITAIPDTLERRALSFPVTYVDPWGGKVLKGTIHAPVGKYAMNLKDGAMFDPNAPPTTPQADFPQTRVGLSNMPKGESSVLILGGLIGAQ